jgi:PIN domain nuclease of toxin-antitoxin system
MVTYVLDSSAVLRYLHDKAGSDRVAEIIKGRLAGDCEALISAAHWGEVAGITCKLYGRREMEQVLSRLSALGLRVASVDGELAVQAALIKLQRAIPYVDAFGIALTALAPDGIFVTSDFDFKSASRDVKIEFLPAL